MATKATKQCGIPGNLLPSLPYRDPQQADQGGKGNNSKR